MLCDTIVNKSGKRIVNELLVVMFLDFTLQHEINIFLRTTEFESREKMVKRKTNFLVGRLQFSQTIWLTFIGLGS